MLDSTRGLRVIVLASIVACIIASLTGATGQDKNAAGLKIASVDIGRIQDEYTAIKALKQELDSKKSALDTELQTWGQNQLLSEADQKSLSDLAVKEKSANGLNAQETAVKQSLLDKSKKLNDDLQRLQSTKLENATESDKQQMQKYIDLSGATQKRSKDAEANLTTEMNNKIKDTAAAAQKTIKETLVKIGKEKGYAVIFSADIAPYTEYDTTDEVLKVLNKK